MTPPLYDISSNASGAFIMKQISALTLILAFIVMYSDMAIGQPLEVTGESSQNHPFEILYFETLPEGLFSPPSSLTAPHSLQTPEQTSEGVHSFEAFGKRFQLSLSPNNRLVDKLPSPKRQHLEESMQFFRGTLADIPGSWVRLTRIGPHWSGMIWDGQEAYLVDSLATIAAALQTLPAQPSSGHAIYRLSDTRELKTQTCGMGTGSMSGHSMSNFHALMDELKDRVTMTAEGATHNLDMAVVTDEFFTTSHTNPEQAVIARMNVVDGIFSEQLNVQISLVDVLPLQHNGGLTATNAQTLLSQFSEFTSAPSFQHPGVAHLFTSRNLDGDTVGIAFLRSICDARWGVGVDQIIGTGTAGALIVAHELGHNFGAPHDDEFGSPCAGTPGTYLMNPYMNGSDQFSPCSLSQIQPVIAGASCLTVIHREQADLQPRFPNSPRKGPLGQPFFSVLSVSNHGQAQALNPLVRIMLPKELALENILTEGGRCWGNGTSEPTCILDPIPPGEERLITLTLQGTTIGSFTIRAMVAADNETNTHNNMTRGVIIIDNEAPQITITSPQDGAFLFGLPSMTFSGQAHDSEDGNLTEDLIWTSDRDGQIGSGGALMAQLSPGLHTIRASATDKSGATTSAAIMIAIIPEQAGAMLFEAHFDNDRCEFMYLDDAFKHTHAPDYAQGSWEPQQGFSEGGLRVQLGGLNHTDVLGMSGGWRRRLTLSESQMVTVTFRMKLTQAANYEPDEISEALFAIDDRVIGLDDAEFVAQLTGNGNGGAVQNTGWLPVAITLGRLEAGTHHITIGAFNNKKTYQDETTEMLLDDVEVRGLPVKQSPGPDAHTILSSNFDKGLDGFSFMPDLFKRTRHPAYAQGTYLPAGGFSGGGLQVFLGGRNNRHIWGMSGGWTRQFTVTSAEPVTLTFRYSLTQASNYERNEISEALVSVDGKRRSPSSSKFLARLRGNGNGGSSKTTGWAQVTIDLGRLSPGPHVLAIGAYNNKKTFKDESTEMLIDDVLIQQSGKSVASQLEKPFITKWTSAEPFPSAHSIR